MQINLQTDDSSRKKVLLTSILFMGLGHIVCLKEYIKGAFYALIELIMLAFSPIRTILLEKKCCSHLYYLWG